MRNKLRPTYNRSERLVLLTLLAVAAGALAIICVIDGNQPQDAAAESEQQTTRGEAGEKGRAQQHIYYNVEGREAELFAFDPNTADSTQLLRLGLQPWQVRAIYKYRAKGGVFRRKTDFARLHGLTTKQYRLMEPYITIGEDYQPAAESVPTEQAERPVAYSRDTVRFPVKLRRGEHLSANTADTAMLKKVPNIGSHRAAAIVAYRERLGGFVSRQQLLEIASFPADALDYFSEPHEPVRRININKASKAELRRHPYLNFFQVQSLLDYRRKHGHISNIDELALDRDFPPEARQRLKPYLEY